MPGHPKGLLPLFFTEMWERLGFYMLVGILVLYASDVERGGLGMTVPEASGIYGTYLAFVYFTPFLGGMLADRLLGYRKAVLIGGLFMAAGFFTLGTPGLPYLYLGLTLLCIGNGLFKPNISAMVGKLYAPGDPKRDVGFNIFYMGINIGAAVANLAAAPIRNQISWKWAFYAAGIGLLIAVVILLISWGTLARADQPNKPGPDDITPGRVFGVILLPAAVAGAAGYFLGKAFLPEGFPVTPTLCAFLLGMVPILAFLFNLARTAPPEEKPGMMALMPVFVAGGTFFMILHLNGSALTVWAKESTDRQVAWTPEIWKQDALASYFGNADAAVPRPDARTLMVVDEKLAKMFGTKKMHVASVAGVIAKGGGLRAETIWDPVAGAKTVAPSWDKLATFVFQNADIEVKEKVQGEGEKRKVSYTVEPKSGVKPTSKVVFLRQIGGKDVPVYLVTKSVFDKVYAKASAERLPPGEFLRVVSPEVYQSWNPIFVVLLTPLVVMFFAARVRRGAPISTARKIFYGMLLTSTAMAVMAVAGGLTEGGATKVSGMWLVGAYAVITIGELCLSPMSLSLVTKLAPARLVGLMMGGWFVATAFGNKLSGFLGQIQGKMAPSNFFLLLTGCAMAVALFIFALLGRLEKAIERYEK
ncbi:MAG: peptide MFS transporter [Planctomycetes bacterium]|nr:peptide MFS transporter [Planctomycetota bacterium]MCB9870011.1 peptide MFS transporter [Planctomycetota bacterium]